MRAFSMGITIRFGILATGLVSITLGFVPSSIEKTIYNSQFSSDISTSRVYFDGLGREIMTLTEEGAGDVVSAINYDESGRPVQSVKPFYSLTHGHAWNAASDFVSLQAEANTYFSGTSADRPNAGGYAFSKTEYLPDPLRRVKEQSAAGSAFQLAGGHTLKKWYIGANLPDFILAPTEASLNALSNGMGAKYTLEVTKDEDNRYSQLVKDNFGRVLKTVSDPNPSSLSIGDEIVTQNFYDAEGRLTKTLLPGPGGAPDPSMAVTYTYSSEGKLLEETYPDEGKTQYLYDEAGRLRLKRDARNIGQTGYYSYMTYYKYDIHDRKIEEGSAEFANTNLTYYFNSDRLSDPEYPGTEFAKAGLKRWYYDNLDKLDPFINVPMDVDISSDPNATGKLVASIAYNNMVGSGSAVMKFFRYDNEGRVAHKYVVIPETPTQYFKFFYDIQGRVIEKQHIREAPNAPYMTYTDYNYDVKGRMTRAAVSGGQDILYTYDPLGKLNEKNVGGLVSDRRAYTIRDWVKTIDVQNLGTRTNYLFSEALTYESAVSPTVPQYGGNVSIATHRYYDATKVDQIGHSYTYDGANRLINTAFTTEFQEAFTYDARGRILTKKENGVTYGPYEYNAGTNQVKRIQAHPTRSDAAGNFFYDAHGNMIYDRSKKMGVFYDNNNMPYLFHIYNADPAPGNYQNNFDVKSAVEILYDADSQRVLKRNITY